MRPVNAPRELGIVPVKLPLVRESAVRVVKAPSELGIVPVKLLPDMTMALTSPLLQETELPHVEISPEQIALIVTPPGHFPLYNELPVPVAPAKSHIILF